MSQLLGHYAITVEAIRRLQNSRLKAPVARSIYYDDKIYEVQDKRQTISDDRGEWHFRLKGSANHFAGTKTRDPAWGSVMCDIRDTWVSEEGSLTTSGGHLENWAQKHHFMRRFDGQSPYAAYRDGVKWIREEAEAGARILQGRIQACYSTSLLQPSVLGTIQSPGQFVPSTPPPNLFQGETSDRVGNALHALQDTFSGSHVIRELTAQGPGDIAHVKVYRGVEEHDHGTADEAWLDGTFGSFSASGEFAVRATEYLLRLIIDNAMRPQCFSRLDGWQQFERRWLAASSDLKKNVHWDFAIDYIERFYNGPVFKYKAGAFGFPSWGLDEKGLATALRKELGYSWHKLLKVFKRLNEERYTDADDVAVHFVEQLMAQKSCAALTTLKKPGSYLLIDLLIEILEDGPTFCDEEKAIEFLKKIKLGHKSK